MNESEKILKAEYDRKCYLKIKNEQWYKERNVKYQREYRKRDYVKLWIKKWDSEQKWYNKNKDKPGVMDEINKKKRSRYMVLKHTVFDHYGWVCNCCGEKHKSFLTIDHVNNDGGKDRKNGIDNRSMLRTIIKDKFPKTYQILCMNCNFSKRIEGICEHLL